jgi:hypothetical protein
MSFDGKAFGAEIVAAVKDHLEREIAPLLARIAELEGKLAALPTPKDGADGKDGAPGEQGPAGETGERGEPGQKGDQGEPGPAGKDADPEAIAAMVKTEAERILAGWERPQDGKSVTVEEITPLIEESVQRAVAAIPAPRDGKDGLSAVRFLRDAKGNLIVTMTDGSVVELGPVDGKDADEDAILARMLEKMPAASADECAPDDLAEEITGAIKAVAGFVTKAMPAAIVREQAPQQPITVNVHPTAVSVDLPEQPAPQVKVDGAVVHVPAPQVTVELPKKGKEVTRVTEWDKAGRIKAFEKTEE